MNEKSYRFTDGETSEWIIQKNIFPFPCFFICPVSANIANLDW